MTKRSRSWISDHPHDDRCSLDLMANIVVTPVGRGGERDAAIRRAWQGAAFHSCRTLDDERDENEAAVDAVRRATANR